MIQRIQTVYLALAAICLFLVFAFGFNVYTLNERVVEFSAMGASEPVENLSIWFPYAILVAVAGVLCIAAISQFKKRSLQLRIGKMLYLVLLLIIVFLFLDDGNIQTALGEGVKVAYGVGMFLPVAALPFVFLANRAIKKDDKLIKSVDRLRG